MGVTFKISRHGNRYRPKGPIVQPLEAASIDDTSQNSEKNHANDAGCNAAGVPSERLLSSAESEVSFTLDLFPDGYSIGKPLETKTSQQPAQEVYKFLHPYDKASESLFLAIESGCVPRDCLDDIPCKYDDGSLTCELRDYRKCSFSGGSPIVTQVRLRMTLEHVIKEIPLISDESWTYGDLMEVESQLVKALQPQLFLDPTPNLDRLSGSPVFKKIDLGLGPLWKKRPRQAPEVTVTSSNRLHGKKVCIDRVLVNSNGRLADLDRITPVGHNVHENVTTQNLERYPTSASSQDLISYADNVNSNPSRYGKRDNQDGQMPALSDLTKRSRITSIGMEGMNQQQTSSNIDALQGSDVNWQAVFSRGMQYASSGLQHKFPQHGYDGSLNQDNVSIRFAAGRMDMGYGPKEEQFEMENGSDPNRLQSRFSQYAIMRSNMPQAHWSHIGQSMEKDARKGKSVQSPRLSSGGLQSPLSSKSGEFSSASVGPNFGVTLKSAALVASQKEKTSMSASIPALVSSPSLNSGVNESMQKQQQAQVAAEWRSNSLPKIPVSGVSSPSSVTNISVPLNANSPSVGSSPLADQTMLERFSKIEMVTKRHQLNCKRNMVDNPIRKQTIYSTQQVLDCLATASNIDELKDDDALTKSLSKSLVGGSMNSCKIRVLTVLLPEQVVQGNNLSYVRKIQTRMIMSKKQLDGTVAMHFGEITDGDYLAVEEYLPTLPNTHFADLLAAQFAKLMEHYGYTVDDRIQPRPNHMNLSTGIQPNVAGSLLMNSAAGMQQCGEPASCQSNSEVAKPANSANSSLNPVAHTRMLPPGTPQSLQTSQLAGVSTPPRPPQVDPQQQQNQHFIQQQNSQFQRPPMVGANLLSHLTPIGQNPNMQLGNHAVNKPSHVPLPLLQQQSQMPRKMMMGLGPTMGMGNMGNNMVGLGGLGSGIGMGAVRGTGGTGISASMASISGMGTPLSLNQASNVGNFISQQLKSGTITPAHAAFLASKLRMAPNQRNMMGTPQSSVAGMSGPRSMHPSSAGLSMLSQTLNRANMGALQRPAIGPMGPPKLAGGMNLYMNQQQLPQQLQQQQQQHLQQQLQHQLQQQQETTSPLQSVVSPQQVGSPSTIGVPQLSQQNQQQASPQQMSQRTPMSPQQMSSGAIHAMSAGNPEACPASPQLSSQTLGSVGSITNSPMDLQGVNKSNSVNNG